MSGKNVNKYMINSSEKNRQIIVIEVTKKGDVYLVSIFSLRITATVNTEFCEA